jgi:hypothetical protein
MDNLKNMTTICFIALSGLLVGVIFLLVKDDSNHGPPKVGRSSSDD